MERRKFLASITAMLAIPAMFKRDDVSQRWAEYCRTHPRNTPRFKWITVEMRDGRVYAIRDAQIKGVML